MESSAEPPRRKKGFMIITRYKEDGMPRDYSVVPADFQDAFERLKSLVNSSERVEIRYYESTEGFVKPRIIKLSAEYENELKSFA